MQTVVTQTIHKNSITTWLNKSPIATVIYFSLCAFVIYTCMYGFRKPYTVAEYNNIFFLGMPYKVCLVIAQVIGYMCSKFYGIKFISAMQPSKRAFYIILFIGIAWASLLLFAIIPAPYNIICMFINGLPLGMIFGLVFGFLEGRKTTEIMGAFLVTSFIFGSGLAKTIGKWILLHFHIPDMWMPFSAGAVYILPLLLFVWLLHKSPAPSQADIANRSPRNPMTSVERKALLQQFGISLIPIVITYVMLTIVRDFSEDFANELWIETGYKNNAAIFTQTSTIISLVVITIIGSFFLIKNNFTAFKAVHFLVMGGLLLSTISTILFQLHFIHPFAWIVMATMGIYLGYLPFNCLYFERMIAAYKMQSNVGFVMYIADAFGYLGTVLVLLIKSFITIKYSWVHFFSFLFFTVSIVGFVLVAISFITHTKMHKNITNSI
jgi:MFS family permease